MAKVFKVNPMTYILGISRNGINAIICDQRVTWQDSDQKIKAENIALKCGKLFEGCIYGIAGSVEVAMEYIYICKQCIKEYRSKNGVYSAY